MPAQELTSYGGQAVIEGVMMRGRQTLAVAVRAPDQQLVVHTQPLPTYYRGRLARLPFLRGLLGLSDAFSLGYQSLTFSAGVASGEQVKFEGVTAWGTMLLSVGLSLGLFMLTPAAAGQFSERVLHFGPWLGNLAEGVVRLGLLIGYLWVIGRIPEIQRVFGYHGAEHKTINAFEAGAELTPASVARFPLEHPRCGTAFLLNVVLFSVLLFGLLGPLPLWLRLASRILLIPVIASVAFEYIRFTARHLDHPLVRWLVVPNLALQRLTTREPDASMLEAAIAAFNAMRAQEAPAAAGGPG